MLVNALLFVAAWQAPLQIDRRAVLSAAVPALLATPLPAAAKSKEAAKKKAMQKETASEVRQAMKEYKTAPRPELVGNAQTGYTYKADTVKAGSQGELASYFKEKGSVIQAEYASEKARATGATKADAAKLAASLEDKAAEERRAAYLAKRNSKSFDEIEIEKFCKTADPTKAVDNLGRSLCR